ncbi:MAG TPA: DUF6134 family protein [Chitinophagaceae bacterium]|nr:DUF6134 family protein [Chitinophagaceae bacterium]
MKPLKSALVALLTLALSTQAQQKKFEYAIKRNGDQVGTIHFTQGVTGNRTVLTMESEVNTRFIFSFKARAKEEAIYDNGIMTWSSIYRKLNGNVKVDKKTKANGNTYTVYKGSKTETLNNYPIRYNMLSVYVAEPVNITQVYSDNFQQQVTIQKVADHHYKIKFPDGNYSEYFYTNGVCSKVEIHHTLYRATIELKS